MNRQGNKTGLLAVIVGMAVLTCAAPSIARTHNNAKQSAPIEAASALSPAIDATPVLTTSRMVTYTWTGSRSFAIRALGGMDTDVEVPEGETIEGFYLSDASDWSFHVTADHKRVLIKPAQQGLYNTALMVTDKRSYQLTLVSVPPTDVWFQRVQWVVPTANVDATGAYWAPGSTSGSTADQAAGSESPSVNPADLYFRYDISGKATFRPLAVFDDGQRTWMRFDPKAQDLPAIFAMTDGKLDVVNYNVAHGYVIIPRVAAKFVLQLDGDKVTVERGCDPARCLR